MADGEFASVKATDDSEYQVYFSGAPGKDRPGLIIFSPIFGVDTDIVTIADRWASEGYRVAAPDWFFRVKPGTLDRSEGGRAEAMARWKQIDVSKVIDDVRPLALQLSEEPDANAKLGVIGFCAGGEMAFLSATRLGADVVAAFHGTRIQNHLGELDKAKGRISLHFGDRDFLVPMADVEKIQEAMNDRKGAEVYVYEGAEHGFSFEGRPSYQEAAATQSRAHAAKLMQTLK